MFRFGVGLCLGVAVGFVVTVGLGVGGGFLWWD